MIQNEQNIAEQATGIAENSHGLGKFFRHGGDEVTPQKAYDLLREGQSIEVPNAGAGSYGKFFTGVGFSEVRNVENMSSAGDWTHAVKDGAEGDWYPAFQSNRYPYHGFAYSVDFNQPFPSFESMCESFE